MFGVKLSYLFLLKLLIHPLNVCGKKTEELSAPEDSKALTLSTIGWEQIGSDIDGERSGNEFGISVSMSGDGNRIVVGGSTNRGVNGIYSGHARTFEYVTNEWQQIGSDIDGEARFNFFGTSVSMSGDGNRIIVGGILNDGVNGIDSGHARAFEYVTDDWQQIGSDIEGEASGDEFGVSVSMSGDGNRIVVGSYGNDGVNGIDSGHARAFEYVINEWVQIGSDIDGEATGDRFGNSVSMSEDGNRIVVSSHRNDGVNGMDSGHARAFEYVTNDWQQIGSDIEGEASSDLFGWSVSMSGDGNRLVVGSHRNDGVNGIDSGHARAFEYVTNEWQQIGSDIDGEGIGDYFGWSVSMSGDGNRIVVGGPRGPGYARTFEYVTNEWVQIGSDIDGEASDDWFGESVSMSGNGNRVVVGGSLNGRRRRRPGPGHVRAFEFMELSLSETNCRLGLRSYSRTLINRLLDRA